MSDDDFTPDDPRDVAPIETTPALDAFIPSHRGNHWFAVNLARGVELAPVFDTEVTAEEVGRKCTRAEPFFDRIPCVPLDTPFPRPDSVVWKPAKDGGKPTPRQGRAVRTVQRRPLG